MSVEEHTRFVAALARTVDQLRRSNEAGEPQKAALRALVALAAERSATLRFYDNVLTVDGEVIPTADPRLAPFPERLSAQSVAEIVIARGAEPGELLALASGLAAAPGHGRIKEKLRDAASTRVMVVSTQVDVAPRQMSISGAFAKVKMDQEVLKEWNKFLDHGAKGGAEPEKQVKVDLQAQSTGEVQIDVGAVGPASPTGPSMPVLPPRTVGPPPVPAAAAAAAPPPPPAPPPAPALPQPPTLAAASPLGVALAKLLGDPFGQDTLAKVTVLSRQIQDAYTQDRVAEAIDALNTLIDLENRAPDAVKSTYGVILRRTLTRAVLAQSAPYLLEPRRKGRALAVVKRGGEEALLLLVGLLAASQTIGERMTYLEVLREIPTGVDQVLGPLSRSEWQVVRNTAEVAGEAKLEPAIPYLARLVEHNDERVRRAAIVALAKIGTVATLEPLRNALKGGSPELKTLVLGGIGAQARALTAPIATAADQEENPEVIRACYKALSRIGTPEAKQAIERAASQRALFSRRARVAKEAAEEALKTFGT